MRALLDWMQLHRLKFCSYVKSFPEFFSYVAEEGFFGGGQEEFVQPDSEVLSQAFRYDQNRNVFFSFT